MWDSFSYVFLKKNGTSIMWIKQNFLLKSTYFYLYFSYCIQLKKYRNEISFVCLWWKSSECWVIFHCIYGILFVQSTGISEELQYSISRLVKGLASSRQSARHGFSVALCQVKRHYIYTVPSYSWWLELQFLNIVYFIVIDFKSTDPSKLPKHKCGHDTWCCCRTSKVYAEGITIGM